MGVTISRLNAVFDATVAPFVSGVSTVESVLGRLNNSATTAISTVAQIVGVGALIQTGMAGISAAFGTLNDSISLAATLESNAVAFETMTGSAETGLKTLQQIEDFAQQTPFRFPELAQAGKSLIAFGISADQVLPTLHLLGDLASGTGADLGELAAAYGKVKARAKLTGEEIRQFVHHGVPLVAQLAKQFGVTEGEVYKMSEAGQVSFGAVQRALAALTADGGTFAHMIERQSQTIGGLWSTLTDNITITSARIVTAIVDAFNLRDAMRGIIRFTDAAGPYLIGVVQRAAPAVKAGGLWLYGIVAGVVKRIGTAIGNIYQVAAPIVKTVYDYVAPIVMDLGRQIAAGFGTAAAAVSQAGEIIYGIVAPIGRVWATSENVILTVKTLAGAYVAASIAAKAWWVSTIALAAAQYGGSVAALGYSTAVAGVMLAARGVAVAQAAARATIASGVIQTVAATAASWTATAATQAWAAASWVTAAAANAVRVAVMSTLAGQAIYQAAQYAGAAATAAYTTARYAAVVAWDAIRAAALTTTATVYAQVAAERAAAAVTAVLTTAYWAATAAVIAFDGTLSGVVLAYEAARAVVVTSTAGVYAYSAAQLAVSAAVAGFTAVQWAAASAYAAVKTVVVTSTAAVYAGAAAEYAGAAALLAFNGARWAAVTAIGALTAFLDAGRIAQAAWYAVTLIGTGAQIAWTAAVTAGQAIMATLAGVFNAAAIASAAWSVATGLATAAQWLLNVALNANPVGLVVIGITALAAAFVAVGGATAVVIAGMAGITAGSGFLKQAFAVAEFAAKNWQLSLKLAGAEVAYFAVKTANQLVHLFTVQIPAALDWMKGNWRNIFTDMYNFVGTVFTNIGSNAVNFASALISVLTGGDFDFEWTGLTEGFKSTVSQFPGIAEREIGPLEKELGEKADRMVQQFKDGMAGIEAHTWADLGDDGTSAFFDDEADAAKQMAKAQADAEATAKKAMDDAEKNKPKLAFDDSGIDQTKKKIDDVKNALLMADSAEGWNDIAKAAFAAERSSVETSDDMAAGGSPAAREAAGGDRASRAADSSGISQQAEQLLAAALAVLTTHTGFLSTIAEESKKTKTVVIGKAKLV